MNIRSIKVSQIPKSSPLVAAFPYAVLRRGGDSSNVEVVAQFRTFRSAQTNGPLWGGPERVCVYHVPTKTLYPLHAEGTL